MKLPFQVACGHSALIPFSRQLSQWTSADLEIFSLCHRHVGLEVNVFISSDACHRSAFVTSYATEMVIQLIINLFMAHG